jgi:hypothetical protein
MDRRRFWFGEYVTDLEMDDLCAVAQAAEQAIHVDAGVLGILAGMEVTEHYVGTTASPDLTVDVSAGAARDETGLRIPLITAGNVDLAVDYLGASTNPGSGKHRCVSLFCKQAIVQTEIHAKKSGGSVYRIWTEACTFEVRQGAESAVADPLVKPALMNGYVLLADVVLTHDQTQILGFGYDIDIDPLTGEPDSRRQDQVVLAGTPHAIRRGWLKDAISDLLGWFDAHVDGSDDQHDAVDVTAAGVSQTPYTLTAGSVGDQLAELLTKINDHQSRCQAHNALQYVTDYSSGDSIPLALQTEDSDPDGMFTPYDSTGKAFTADNVTDVFTCSGHGYADGDTVRFSGTPPSPLLATTGLYYYVRDRTNDTFKLAATQGGVALSISDDGVAGQKIHKAQTKFFFSKAGWYRAHARVEWPGAAAPDGGRGLTLRVSRVSPPSSVTAGQAAVAAVTTANESTVVDCSAPMFYVAAGAGAYYLEVVGRQTYSAPGYSLAVVDVYLSTWFLGP